MIKTAAIKKPAPAKKYNKCPWCKSTSIEPTDYEDESGEVEDDGVRCKKCQWEGHADELVGS